MLLEPCSLVDGVGADAAVAGEASLDGDDSAMIDDFFCISGCIFEQWRSSCGSPMSTSLCSNLKGHKENVFRLLQGPERVQIGAAPSELQNCIVFGGFKRPIWVCEMVKNSTESTPFITSRVNDVSVWVVSAITRCGCTR